MDERLSSGGLVGRADCVIDRHCAGQCGKALLIRADTDDVVHSFPEAWTDEQIMYALEFANYTYRAGFMNGATSKVREIRSALRIEG